MSEPVDERAIEALRRDRESAAPSDAQARVASRLAAFLSLPEATRTSTASTSAVGGGPLTARVAMAFVLGGGVGALLHAELMRNPAPRIVYVERPAPSGSSIAPPLPALQPPATSGGMSAPFSAAQGIESKTTLHPAIPQLDAERALLDAARAALVSGDTDIALGALDRHARTYAHPILAEERDALLVQALVRAGRYNEARTRAEAFRDHTPNSLFRPAVDAAVGSIP
jgi:hypothetical protein